MPSPKKKTEAQHTPGPWRIVGADGLALAIWGPLAQDVVSERGGPMRQEDARLIASAPELLQRLEDCAESLVCVVSPPPSGRATRDECGCWACELAATARAAIAKARGES